MNHQKKNNGTLSVQVIIKTLAIVYLLCFACMHLTTSTQAQFMDASVQKQSIKAGEWWDGSSLTFLNTDHQIIEGCGPATLQTEVFNESTHQMYGQARYEVYRALIDTENELAEIGEKVSEAIMYTGIIGANESSTLTYTAASPGNYIFKVYQRPGYNNEEAHASVLSGVLTISCTEDIKPEEKND